MRTEAVRVTEEIAEVMRDMTPVERSHVFEVGLCVIRDSEAWGPQHLQMVIRYLVNHNGSATVQNIVDLARRCAVDAHEIKAGRVAA